MSDEVDLKSLIISNATFLFAQNGFNKTSIQKIADTTKTSQTNVLYHFKTKKVLFEACLLNAISKNRQILLKYKSKSKFDSLIHLLNTNVNWAIKSPHECQLFLLMFYFASNDEHFLKLSTRLSADGQNLLKEYLSTFSFKSGFDLESTSSILQSYIHGVMFNIISRKDKSIKANYKNNIENIVLNFIEVK